MEDISSKINELRKELKNLEEAYYSGLGDLTSDDLYDYKLRELIQLEQQNPNLITPDSPTQKVGSYSLEDVNIEHEIPMLSLSNAFNKEDLEAYFNNCQKSSIEDDIEYILEPKIDGASISLIYEKGYLKKAISRGDGEKGEDLTYKLLHMDNLPLKIGGNQVPEKLTLRGEIYITKSDFQSIKEGKSFANPRNYVSGTLRLKEARKLKNKKLKICIYQLLYPEELGFSSQSQILETIKEWGLETHPKSITTSNKKEIYEYIETFGKGKNDSDIPYDGLVLKVNKLSLWDEIGYTSKFPKWAIAYKYPALIKESQLLEIFPTVGRTGKITYSAKIAPVEIEGSVVQYATLHNANYIKDLDLRIGDMVSIYKSGEVVPKIIGFNREKRLENAESWTISLRCPSCDSLLEERDNLATQYCPNEDCVEKNCARMVHWCSRKAADIEGLSIQIINKLNGIGVLKNIGDIYRIKDHKEKVINSGLKIKEKSFSKLILAIEKSKNKDWRYLLYGLGINFIGEEGSYHISNKFKNIENLLNATIEDLKKTEGIGDKGAESIFHWLQKNRNLIDELKSLNLFQVSTNEELIQSFITGKKVTITGKLKMPRNEFAKLLSQKYGAIVQNDISSRTNILIAGEGAGSKLKKAQEKNIVIMTEEEILSKLEKLELKI